MSRKPALRDREFIAATDPGKAKPREIKAKTPPVQKTSDTEAKQRCPLSIVTPLGRKLAELSLLTKGKPG